MPGSLLPNHGLPYLLHGRQIRCSYSRSLTREAYVPDQRSSPFQSFFSLRIPMYRLASDRSVEDVPVRVISPSSVLRNIFAE